MSSNFYNRVSSTALHVALDSRSKSKDFASLLVRIFACHATRGQGGCSTQEIVKYQIQWKWDSSHKRISRCRIGFADVDTQSDSNRPNRVEWHLTARSIPLISFNSIQSWTTQSWLANFIIRRERCYNKVCSRQQWRVTCHFLTKQRPMALLPHHFSITDKPKLLTVGSFSQVVDQKVWLNLMNRR